MKKESTKSQFLQWRYRALVDRIQAVLDAGADYQTYTDIADGVNGSVKFIIKTDAVKAED